MGATACMRKRLEKQQPYECECVCFHGWSYTTESVACDVFAPPRHMGETWYSRAIGGASAVAHCQSSRKRLCLGPAEPSAFALRVEPALSVPVRATRTPVTQTGPKHRVDPGYAAYDTRLGKWCVKRGVSTARNAAYDTLFPEWRAECGILARETPHSTHRTRNDVLKEACRQHETPHTTRYFRNGVRNAAYRLGKRRI